MTRLPQLAARELLAFLRKEGFEEDRQAGSHLTVAHPDGRTVTVPVHPGTDLGRGLTIRILRDAGYSVDDYLRLR